MNGYLANAMARNNSIVGFFQRYTILSLWMPVESQGNFPDYLRISYNPPAQSEYTIGLVGTDEYSSCSSEEGKAIYYNLSEEDIESKCKQVVMIIPVMSDKDTLEAFLAEQFGFSKKAKYNRKTKSYDSKLEGICYLTETKELVHYECAVGKTYRSLSISPVNFKNDKFAKYNITAVKTLEELGAAV